MISQHDIDTILSGRGHVLDTHGAKIGSVGQVYLDDQSGDPSWVTIKTGLFGTSESFAPLQGANVNGDDVTIAYTKDQVKDAPRIDADGDLSPEEEDSLYRHYGISGHIGQTGQTETTDRDFRNTTTADTVADVDRTRETVGHDTSGPTTDTAMTRSEEQLRVGVERREAGKVRLRKYVVTENVTQTIPVRHEEVRIEREPITNANQGEALAGSAFTEEEYEVVLHAERAIVDKEAVAVERVRLDKETVTEQHQVNDTVRKEEIEIIDDTQDTKKNR